MTRKLHSVKGWYSRYIYLDMDQLGSFEHYLRDVASNLVTILDDDA